MAKVRVHFVASAFPELAKQVLNSSEIESYELQIDNVAVIRCDLITTRKYSTASANDLSERLKALSLDSSHPLCWGASDTKPQHLTQVV